MDIEGRLAGKDGGEDTKARLGVLDATSFPSPYLSV
jgi:hypothetical protein